MKAAEYPWATHAVYEPAPLRQHRRRFLTRTGMVVLAIIAVVLGGTAALVLA